MEKQTNTESVFKIIQDIPRRPNLDCYGGAFEYKRDGVTYVIDFPLTSKLPLDVVYERINNIKESKGDPEIAFSEEYQLLKEFVINVACGQYSAIQAKEVAQELYLLNKIDFPRYTS